MENCRFYIESCGVNGPFLSFKDCYFIFSYALLCLVTILPFLIFTVARQIMSYVEKDKKIVAIKPQCLNKTPCTCVEYEEILV